MLPQLFYGLPPYVACAWRCSDALADNRVPVVFLPPAAAAPRRVSRSRACNSSYGSGQGKLHTGASPVYTWALHHPPVSRSILARVARIHGLCPVHTEDPVPIFAVAWLFGIDVHVRFAFHDVAVYR